MLILTNFLIINLKQMVIPFFLLVSVHKFTSFKFLSNRQFGRCTTLRQRSPGRPSNSSGRERRPDLQRAPDVLDVKAG